MLIWKKVLNEMPPHQKEVFGWHRDTKSLIHTIWWDENFSRWQTLECSYSKEDISHWVEYPSAPEDDEQVVPVTENPCKEVDTSYSYAHVPNDADIDWWVNEQIDRMDDESRKNILDMENSSEMNCLGFSVGMGIRNYYGLWHKNGLTRYFNRALGVYHADDMSAILLEALWHRVHNQPYDPAPSVERFREHWTSMGCNMKGEDIKENPGK